MKIWTPLFFIIILFISCSESTQENQRTLTQQEINVTSKAVFSVEGMMCEKGCKSFIQNKVTELQGIDDCNVDFENNMMTVEFDKTLISTVDIVNLVKGLIEGQYSATLLKEFSYISNSDDDDSKENIQKEIQVSEFHIEFPDLIHLFTDWL